MSAGGGFNGNLRFYRQKAGYTSASAAWQRLVAIYEETPSLTTFGRWESEPDADRRADPATIEIYCRELLHIDPYKLSPRMGDRCKRLKLLLDGNAKRGRRSGDRRPTDEYPRGGIAPELIPA